MTGYRIQYAGEAEKVRAQMPSPFRARFDAEIARTLGRDPYGHGSGPAGPPREKDRRHATVAGALVRYYIAGAPVLVVTTVEIVHL
ncbi:hypothetical protein GCM10010387_04390 [Streptomyces inusitatus]|uniref:Uncharacterized protein n=1 Tax=Streptomyces inusitatus TaxID=68221 RepID=A0A918PMX1_9ACTN|nr:hypothetical protein [Streptomyces inusitatus]GGZ15215.1 hypothetical protein GCM10010387_04390 [Streptomyces inusitatus]